MVFISSTSPSTELQPHELLVTSVVIFHLYDGWKVHDFNEPHFSPVAPGFGVNGLAFFPLVVWRGGWRVSVVTVEVASMFALAVLTPPVIGYHLVLRKQKH